MSTTKTEIVSTETKPVSVPVILGKFTGMLAGFQRLAYRDLTAAGIEPKIAHKVSVDYGSQIGLAMRNDDTLRTKVAKANKDGIHKLSGAFSDKMKMHNASGLIRVIQTVDSLVREKLLTSYTVNVSNLAESIQDYLGECKLWANEQTWEVEKPKV